MEKLHSNIVVQERSSLLEEMKKEVYQHSEVISFLSSLAINQKMIEENIPLIYRYIEDVEACKKCPGLEKCQKSNPHLVLKLKNNQGSLISTLSPCPFLLKEMIMENKFIYHDFPDSLLNITLREMDKNSPRLETFLHFKNNIEQKESSWIYVKGCSKSGKTFLAATIGNEYIRKYHGTVSHIDTPTRFDELNKLYYVNRDSFYHELLLISKSHLLILDNFGQELKSDVIRDEILSQILSYRNEHNLLTIFLSQYSISDVVDMYDKNRYAKEKAYAIGKLIAKKCQKEISLGNLPIYQ